MAEKVEVIAELKDLVSGHLKDITNQVGRLEGAFSNVGKVNSSGGGGLMSAVLGGNLLTQAIQRTAGAVYDFGKDSLRAFGQFEQFQTSLTTMFKGNRKEAEMLSGQLEDLAKSTPFELTEIQEATKMMIAYGSTSGSVKKELTMLGDISSGVGAPLKDIAYLYGTLRTQGRAYAMDIRQFAGRGIPIIEALAKQFKVNKEEVMKLVEQGKVGFPQVEKALKGMTKEGGQFFDMMKEQSKTLNGQISNMKDSFEQLKVGVGESFADLAKDIVKFISEGLNEANKRIKAANLTRRIFEKEGIGYSFMEQMTGKDAYNTIMQESITKAIGEADTEAEMHMLKSVFAKRLSSISETYQSDILRSSNKSQDKEIATQYLRERSELKNAMETLDQSLASLKEANKLDKSKATGSNSALESLAKANRPTQITVNIENLVRENTNIVNNDTGKAMKLTQEEIAKALLSAVNDFSVLNFQ